MKAYSIHPKPISSQQHQKRHPAYRHFRQVKFPLPVIPLKIESSLQWKFDVEPGSETECPQREHDHCKSQTGQDTSVCPADVEEQREAHSVEDDAHAEQHDERYQQSEPNALVIVLFMRGQWDEAR